MTVGACNGDGNGRIDETFLFWEHLALANMIPGSYTGYGENPIDTDDAFIGINMPETIRGGGIYLQSLGAYDYKNQFIVGSDVPSEMPDNALFPPNETRMIDIKMDDRVPLTGNVWGITGADAGAGSCVTGSGSSATYTLTNTSVACRLFIFMQGIK